MPDNTGDTFRDTSQPEGSNDPLGILGWVIGGKYKIRDYIGGGGFGEVYDGFNVNLPEQRLVIKFFKRVQSRDKFAKEAKILCLLDHPNILRVIDYLPEEGALIVPFIDGRDGGKTLKESGPLQEDLYLRVARTMTDALAYAHDKKIAHRDLKPGNILIDKNEHVYLIDFGIAKEMGGSATKTAYVALTPLFAAPERQRGDQDYNPFLSDIYEMGVTLFNFATNEMPYRNPGNPNYQEWGGPAIKKLSPQLRRILRKATHPDPAERYQTAAQMAEEFRSLDQVYAHATKPRYLAIAAVIVLIAVAAFVAKQMFTGGGPEPQVSQTTPQEKAKEPPKIPQPQEKQKQDSTALAKKPETPPVTVTKPAEEKTTPVQKQETPKTETPPAPQLPTLLVHVIPQYNVSLIIDDKERSPDRRIELNAGKHEVKIIHPDFPILVDTVNLTVDRSAEYNLTNRNAGASTINFRIGISPSELGDNILQVTFNGKKHQYKNEELPILDFRRIVGTWQFRFDILLSGGRSAARVDSIVTFPYGDGPQLHWKGAGNTVNFGAGVWRDIESIDMLLFWSNR
jgi:serine/threonine protein kinase